MKTILFPFTTIIDEKVVPVDPRYLINNCVTEHLFKQIATYRPKVILCNGSWVCSEMIRLFKPQTDELISTLTSYKATVRYDDVEHSFWIILSGFIGRIDDRNKRRLGKELEIILAEENIIL